MTEKPDWEKKSQKSVNYSVPSPPGREGEECSNCSMFIPAHRSMGPRCTDVEGPIFRTGWCKIWDEKK